MLILNDFFLFLTFFCFIGLTLIFRSLINFMLLGELIWISLYNYAISGAIYFNSLTFLIWSIFLLCLAASESTIGISLLIFKALIYGEQRLDNDFLNINNSSYLDYLN